VLAFSGYLVTFVYSKVKGYWLYKQEGTSNSLGYPEETIVDYQLHSMKKKLENFSDPDDCPIRNVLDRFGDKWSILVILVLGQKNCNRERDVVMRFNEIRQTIGNISQKMLTVTLRTLESDGLVTRTHYPEIPPRVEYELTDLGWSLLPHIDGLTQWALRNQDAIVKTRKKFSARMELA